jgi:magnesium/cobalt transport protein CorA
MQVLHFKPERLPVPVETGEYIDLSEGFFWLDVERNEDDWQHQVRYWLKGIRLHDRHTRDILNETHPPYYDGTEDYDLLVMRSLCPDCPPEAPTTHPVAFIISGNCVISMRPPADPVFEKLRERMLSNLRKPPASPAMLLYLLLNQITDTLLSRRDVISELLSRWQERLLDREDQFDDWQALMRLRGQLRRLEVSIETQSDALDEWRDQTGSLLDRSLAVHYNDLQEHLRRVYNHAVVVQNDIDALIQVYFSANTQRTNDTLQFLTILSAVFLPLNLLAGLFGMNFKHMPWLSNMYAPWILLGTMTLIVIGLLLWFRHNRWI